MSHGEPFVPKALVLLIAAVGAQAIATLSFPLGAGSTIGWPMLATAVVLLVAAGRTITERRHSHVTPKLQPRHPMWRQ